MIAERRKEVARMYLSGHPQIEIAQKVGVSQRQVSGDLKRLRQAWQQSALVDIDEAKARELAKLDRLENECWLAWEASKGIITKTTVRNIKGDREIEENSTIEEYSAGDPRFLNGIFQCISKRCEIFGINAPFKIDATSKGRSLQPVEINVTRNENIEKYQKHIDQIAQLN